MIRLSEEEWARVIMQALVVLLRIWAPKGNPSPTVRDRANEAIQRAYMRYVRVQPADVDSVERLVLYLVNAARSEAYNEAAIHETRKEVEAAAVAETEHLGDTKTASAETMNLQRAEDERAERRAKRVVRALRKELERTNDRIALGTMDCIARGIDEPREQARVLRVDVEEIHKARKRRERAAERVRAADQDDEEEEEEEVA